MTSGAWEVVGRNSWELPLGNTIGDALQKLIRKRWKNNAAKQIEKLWEIDPKTARNVVSTGNVSERTLTKAARAERWALWMALGEELFEQTYEQFLQDISDERNRAAERAAADQDHLRRLEARAGRLVSLLDGAADSQPKRGAGSLWASDDGEGAGHGGGGR